MNDKIFEYLNQYTHSTPIIHSHLEDQFPYELYYNENNSFGILLTEFDYHFAFGNIPTKEEVIAVIENYTERYGKDEFILFGPNEEWYPFLESTFNELNMPIDNRVLYHLNNETFGDFDCKNRFIKLEELQETDSLIPYPQASAYIKNELISFSRALMTGKKEVELDVWTDKTQRQKGFGFDTSLTLIKHLLDNGLKPNWSCWEEKEISNILAKKLGFEHVLTYKAFIWLKNHN